MHIWTETGTICVYSEFNSHLCKLSLTMEISYKAQLHTRETVRVFSACFFCIGMFPILTNLDIDKNWAIKISLKLAWNVTRTPRNADYHWVTGTMACSYCNALYYNTLHWLPKTAVNTTVIYCTAVILVSIIIIWVGLLWTMKPLVSVIMVMTLVVTFKTSHIYNTLTLLAAIVT